MVRDPADAEDICQEALIKAHDAIRGFREDASVYTWLYRITINQCVNLLRRKKIWKLIPLDPLSRWLGADQVGPEREAARNDVAMAVERAVSRLPNRQKTVFLLRQYEGFTHEEIAGILGRSVGAVKSSYFHAVQRLQKDLVEYRRYYREGLL
jgi:RNA polymerase sigma-70 factor (ECF subfamily)